MLDFLHSEDEIFYSIPFSFHEAELVGWMVIRCNSYSLSDCFFNASKTKATAQETNPAKERNPPKVKVGKRGTNPVSKYSQKTGIKKAIPRSKRRTPMPPKNGSGR